MIISLIRYYFCFHFYKNIILVIKFKLMKNNFLILLLIYFIQTDLCSDEENKKKEKFFSYDLNNNGFIDVDEFQ